VGVDAARDVASPATAAPEPVFESSRQQRLAESIRILFGTIAFFVFLIALPLVALVPFFMVALFLGGFATLFGGIV
jgi:hypothetical protein